MVKEYYFDFLQVLNANKKHMKQNNNDEANEYKQGGLLIMNTVSSENLEQCLEYSNNNKLYGLGYSSFLRCLVRTIQKELPVEVLDNDNNEIFKGSIINFSIDYEVHKEGKNDSLTIGFKDIESDKEKTIDFLKPGEFKVREDEKSGPRSFYRYYVYGANNKGYRFTFNRRISKNT